MTKAEERAMIEAALANGAKVTKCGRHQSTYTPKQMADAERGRVSFRTDVLVGGQARRFASTASGSRCDG